MEKRFIGTQMGKIAVFTEEVNSNKTPVIFLHGVYFDHNLWENQISAIKDRTVIAIDMPLHGESRENIKANWNLNDCADMLLEILDSLRINKVVAVGHSWGSMTIIRAANKNPNRFESLALFNMPFKASTDSEKRKIKSQHSAMVFRKFYMKQAGKSLFGNESLQAQPELMQKLLIPMQKLSNSEIKFIDHAVRIDAEDATQIIENIRLNIFAIIGQEDYVGMPPIKNTQVITGGHLSPIEAPQEVTKTIRKLLL
jgi:pimeloyl-ACP methyl ester carboxylesterase